MRCKHMMIIIRAYPKTVLLQAPVAADRVSSYRIGTAQTVRNLCVISNN